MKRLGFSGSGSPGLPRGRRPLGDLVMLNMSQVDQHDEVSDIRQEAPQRGSSRN